MIVCKDAAVRFSFEPVGGGTCLVVTAEDAYGDGEDGVLMVVAITAPLTAALRKKIATSASEMLKLAIGEDYIPPADGANEAN